jgi:predicted ATP-grasp superfamily ATP-dependent carboligase
MRRVIEKVAIVGASARAAAFSALRAGYHVVAADLFADADLARVANATRIAAYPDGFADWLAATECDAWMYTGALENSPNLVDRMAMIRPLLGSQGTGLRNVRDPLTLQEAIARAGVPFPESRASADGLERDGSWLCKTYGGASGSGVWRLDSDAALHRAEREHAIFQRVVPGEPAAAIFVVSKDGAKLWGVTRQFVGLFGAGPWQYVGSLGPIDVGPLVKSQLAALGELLAKRFELRGIVGADLILGDEGASVIEVNPRYTASVEILERASGLPILAAHVAACGPDDGVLATARHASTPAPRFHAKTIVFAPRTATILPTFFEWAMERAATSSDPPWLADIPHPGEVIQAGRPILTVFAAGDTEVACERQLRERIAEVESLSYGYV